MRSVNAEICMQEYYKSNKKDLHLLLLFKQLDEYNYVQKKNQDSFGYLTFFNTFGTINIKSVSLRKIKCH